MFLSQIGILAYLTIKAISLNKFDQSSLFHILTNKLNQNKFSKKEIAVSGERARALLCAKLIFGCQSESLAPLKSHTLMIVEMIQVQK